MISFRLLYQVMFSVLHGEVLEMSNVDDQPSLRAMGVKLLEVLWSLTDDERKYLITKISKSIVKRFTNF